MNKQQHQRGATLFVALIFLLIMTMFAVASINLSTVNLKIVGNMQAMKQMEAAAQDAIEQMLSDATKYGLTTSSETFTTTAGGNVSATVTVDPPICINSQTATGYSAVQQNIIPQDNTWEIVAHVNDNVTGATVDLHQGMQMRMLAGNCPTP